MTGLLHGSRNIYERKPHGSGPRKQKINKYLKPLTLEQGLGFHQLPQKKLGPSGAKYKEQLSKCA